MSRPSCLQAQRLQQQSVESQKDAQGVAKDRDRQLQELREAAHAAHASAGESQTRATQLQVSPRKGASKGGSEGERAAYRRDAPRKEGA